jgi:hypothetical protein
MRNGVRCLTDVVFRKKGILFLQNTKTICDDNIEAAELRGMFEREPSVTR